MKATSLARAALVALTLAAPAAMPVGQASATGPVTLSVSSGRPYDRPVVSAPSCVDDATHQRTLTVHLVSGTGHDAVLAGRAQGWPGHPATLVIPDWVNPALPAVVEARCWVFDFTTETDTYVAYAPVAFDVLPPVAPLRQATTFSRTSVKAGQGLSITGGGCTEPDAVMAVTTGFSGADRSGRTLGQDTAGAEGAVANGAFTLKPIFSGGGVEFGLENASEGQTLDPQTAQVAPVVEEPVVFAPGPNTFITECAHQDGSLLMFRPQVVNLSANPAVGRTELDAPGPGRGVGLHGLGCTAGSVRIQMWDYSLQEMRNWSTPTETGRIAPPEFRPLGGRDPVPVRGAQRRTATAGGLRSRSSATQRITGGLATSGSVDTTVNPTSSGAWSYTDQTAFDDGVLFGIGTCGDPFGTGFEYFFQGLRKSPNDG